MFDQFDKLRAIFNLTINVKLTLSYLKKKSAMTLDEICRRYDLKACGAILKHYCCI